MTEKQTTLDGSVYKELKTEIDVLKDRIDTDFNTIKQLIERLRKFEVLQYTPQEMEIMLNRYTKLKYDLREFDVLDIIESNDEVDCYWVLEQPTRKNFKDAMETMINNE